VGAGSAWGVWKVNGVGWDGRVVGTTAADCNRRRRLCVVVADAGADARSCTPGGTSTSTGPMRRSGM